MTQTVFVVAHQSVRRYVPSHLVEGIWLEVRDDQFDLRLLGLDPPRGFRAVGYGPCDSVPTRTLIAAPNGTYHDGHPVWEIR